MIVLRRTLGQAIHIGDDIRIVVTETEKNGRVHLGIEAPDAVSIHRLEIYEKIQAENFAAINGNILDWLKGISNEG
ncbi:carbon storage regulator, CsrA [Mariprofundus aestuarium]|uniref:Translational regulator CsrA n=1 Tax=Mariprofundus aestuarium TaxID=1921086 RepID=A0A2K8KV29_MARES|nr:carbon storage regulator [Mariprofundus aestuarium]ATX78620.1 carbon storage regulator, CsrA [Mariprofundus aestuarium]